MTSRSSSSFGFRSSFNSSDRKPPRENRKEPPNGSSITATTTTTASSTSKRPRISNHHDPDHHLREKRQRSRHNNTESEKAARSIFGDVPLTDTERRYLWSAQSGNLPALESLVEDSASFNLCCRDYLGRTALQLSVLGEHYDCIQLLLNRLRPDIIEEGLLHAIKANHVKICDMFLSQPLYSDPRARLQFQLDHQNGLYEQEDSSSSFANDITPIVLAAQCNNFDIVHMLIQKGFTISTPHNYFCLCPECQTFKDQDRVVHSKSRLNAYRGLASTAYLSLSCDDPIYAAFELSRNLEKLADREKEHKNEYRGLSNQCKDFAVALLDQCRTNDEVMSALHGGTDTFDLSRIKMAIRYDQKKFIAHASCQEQLASMWYSGAPYFQHQSFVIKLLLVPLGIVFIPLTAIIYVFVPYSKLGRILKSPFMKFMNYICSYMAFLVLLFLGTQLTSFQSVHLFDGIEGVVNGLIMFYVLGMFWAECKQLWEEGVHDYFSQMWNYMDITMLALYTAGYSIEGVIYTKADDTEVSENHLLHWKESAILNPQILSKILFSVANVMSFARIAYILPASETFGQLQISYGRMLQDVGKFIFIYVTVMIAFICGLTSLYSITANTNFSGLSQTTGTLFWAAFGLGNAQAPGIRTSQNGNLNMNNGGGGGGSNGGGSGNSGRGGSAANPAGSSGSGGNVGGGSNGGGVGGGNGNSGDGMTDMDSLRVVEMVGYILYGVYILGAVVVLINMLIAMMSNTFEEIQKSEDCEWKFARAKLWISFIEQGTTLPIPFNIIPTPKSIVKMTRIINKLIRCKQGKFDPTFEDSQQRVALEYKAVMHRVVLRYIHKMKFENREESLKDEILDTREEVLYQMHSLMSRLSYRMEILENDLMAVSKNVQAVPGGPPNLTYTKSVPSHGRSSLGSIRHNTSSTSLSAQDKGSLLPSGVPHLRRGRSYYHTRPKYKLSDHSIQYNAQSEHTSSATTTTPTTTTATNNMTTTTNHNNNSSDISMKSLHTHRSLSDSGYNKEEEDPCDILSPLPSQAGSTMVSEAANSSTRTTACIGPAHHDQDKVQGQGYLPLTGVTSSSGITNTFPETSIISTISGKCFDDSSRQGVFVEDGVTDSELLHGRINPVNMRGSYSPRPGEDRHKIVSDANTGRPIRSDVLGSNARWAGGQPEVIEESSLEDHHHPPTPLNKSGSNDKNHSSTAMCSSSSLVVNQFTPLDPLDVGSNLRHCGSVRRRREVMSHHPNIDAPFQPVTESSQGNTFTEYRYNKPKRRETIQNLILDVNTIHNLPGLEMGKESSGSRTPTTGGTKSNGRTIARINSDRRSLSPPTKSNNFFGGSSSKENTTKASNTPRSAEEAKRTPWFNWSHPFIMFYGNHSQENLYHPMQIMREEYTAEDAFEPKTDRIDVKTHDTGVSVNTPNTKNDINTNVNGMDGDRRSGDKAKNSESSFSKFNQNTNIQMKPSTPDERTHSISTNTLNPTDDELERRAVAFSIEGKSPKTSTITTNNIDSGYNNRTMTPLTLEETEVNQQETPRRNPTRKIGMGNIQNVNPILLGEKSFFESLLTSTHNPSCYAADDGTGTNSSNTKRQECVESASLSIDAKPTIQNLQKSRGDDLKHQAEQQNIPVGSTHTSNTSCVESTSMPIQLFDSSYDIEHRDVISDSPSSKARPQQQQNQRRQFLLQQHNQHNNHNVTDFQKDKRYNNATNTTYGETPQQQQQQQLQHTKYPVSTQHTYHTPTHLPAPQFDDDTVIDFPEEKELPYVGMHTGRHFSDSCVVPLSQHDFQQSPHHHHHHHHPHPHISHQHQPHGRPAHTRLYQQNPRNHAFPSSTIGDQQRLPTVPASISYEDDDIINDDDDDDVDSLTGEYVLTKPSAFNESNTISCDHNINRRMAAHQDMYIPPMASNLIPFSVVPNSTPVHHYSGGRLTQDEEKSEEEKQATTGIAGAAGGGEESGDRKRKTSSGRKISLVSLVRGRRSDKVKGKQSEIKHNRSFSLNRFQGQQANRPKHLKAQRSKEI